MRRLLVLMLALGATTLAPAEAGAIPAWARKYKMNCSGCHSPAVPRLNAMGTLFRWAGYRMPEEIGEAATVGNVSEYTAARTRTRYSYSKTEGQDASTSAFQLADVTLFAAGALGKNFGTFLELEHSAEETELVTSMLGVWGKAENFGGFRAGQMHWVLRGSLAGFDRPTGISTPTPLGSRNTTAVPFRFSTDELGVEAFWVNRKNRLSVELLNGVNADGSGMEKGDPDSKDIAVIDQYMYDDLGSGITAVFYYGSLNGLDTALTQTAHFTRFALSASKRTEKVEVMGGYVYSKDSNLPVGSVFSKDAVKGSAYWLYGGYTLPSKLTLFSRYEFTNTNTDVSGSGNTRFVLGGVLPVSLPEYLRVTGEWTYDMPRASGAKKKNGLAIELMINF